MSTPKRAIRSICQLPSLFLAVEPRDTDFDHLLHRLLRVGDVPVLLTDFIRKNARGVRYLNDLRNYQEHPDSARRTIIDNFKVLPSGSVAVPMWYVSGDTPRPLGKEMPASVEVLTEMAEAMLIHLVMASVTKVFPFIIEPIKEANVDAKNPIKYRLSVDLRCLKINPTPSRDIQG